MKKLLFTLATVLLAGNMFAGNFVSGGTEYFYVDDVNVSDCVGGTITVNVKAHFDAYVSSFQVDFGKYVNGEFVSNELPGGLTVNSAVSGSDLTLSYNDYNGNQQTLASALNMTQRNTRFIVANSEANYWDPDEDGQYEFQGVVKWEPGDYEQMWTMIFNIPAGFEGAEIAIKTYPLCGYDNNPDTILSTGETAYYVFNLTGHGDEPPTPEQTATPVINIEYNAEEEYAMISAEGDGDVKLYIDGIEVPNPFMYRYQDEEHEIVVTATAQEDGKEISEIATETYVIPAKTPEPPAPVYTDKPSISYFVDMDNEVVVVTATGNGHIILMWDEQVMAEGEGTATWEIPFCEDPEGEEYGVSATAQEEGKEVSEPAVETIEVPGKQPAPYETPAPVVTTELTDEALVITATGEGTVTLYIQYIDNETGVMTTYPYFGQGTVSVPVARGEEDAYINYWATAQSDDYDDALPGITGVEYHVKVPAKENVEPIDPHATGWWLVLVHADGEEEWCELHQGEDGSYVTTVTLNYGTYGTFYWDPELSAEENNMNRPSVPYYFVVDGKTWSSNDGYKETLMGAAAHTMSNPLYNDELPSYYTVPVGYSYVLGIYVDPSEDDQLNDGTWYYVYCAQGPQTDVNELNAAKTVAGVRYFNMMGQKMQEANGVTIIVTTYTDGTTSAVKVMK